MHPRTLQRRLAGLGRELEIRRQEVEDQESPEAESLKKERDDLEHLKRYALPLIGILAELPTRAPWGAWLESLERLATRALAQLQDMHPGRPVDEVLREVVNRLL